jgi:GNAT superfamily N-acetyltransferase
MGKVAKSMIRRLSRADAEEIFTIINRAAEAYRGLIPSDCYHEPYMPLEELRREMKRMTFFGWEQAGKLVGVMGVQPVKDVTLIRHAYILPDYQRSGIGRRLLDHLKRETRTRRLLVGTWAAAQWAISFYAKNGFVLLSAKDELLNAYWNVPPRQIETSVVLGIEIE